MPKTNMQDAGAPVEDGGLYLGELSQDVGFSLRFAHIAVFNDLVRIFDPFDIRPGQYAALKIIQTNPGLKQTELGRILKTKKPNLVALVNEFEQRDLIDRGRIRDDRRSYALTLSAHGETFLRRVDEAHNRHRRRVARVLSTAEKTQLLGLLDKLIGF